MASASWAWLPCPCTHSNTQSPAHQIRSLVEQDIWDEETLACVNQYLSQGNCSWSPSSSNSSHVTSDCGPDEENILMGLEDHSSSAQRSSGTDGEHSGAEHAASSPQSSVEYKPGSPTALSLYQNPYLRSVLDLQMTLLPPAIPHEGHVPYVPPNWLEGDLSVVTQRVAAGQAADERLRTDLAELQQMVAEAEAEAGISQRTAAPSEVRVHLSGEADVMQKLPLRHCPNQDEHVGQGGEEVLVAGQPCPVGPSAAEEDEAYLTWLAAHRKMIERQDADWQTTLAARQAAAANLEQRGKNLERELFVAETAAAQAVAFAGLLVAEAEARSGNSLAESLDRSHLVELHANGQDSLRSASEAAVRKARSRALAQFIVAKQGQVETALMAAEDSVSQQREAEEAAGRLRAIRRQTEALYLFEREHLEDQEFSARCELNEDYNADLSDLLVLLEQGSASATSAQSARLVRESQAKAVAVALGEREAGTRLKLESQWLEEAELLHHEFHREWQQMQAAHRSACEAQTAAQFSAGSADIWRQQASIRSDLGAEQNDSWTTLSDLISNKLESLLAREKLCSALATAAQNSCLRLTAVPDTNPQRSYATPLAAWWRDHAALFLAVQDIIMAPQPAPVLSMPANPPRPKHTAVPHSGPDANNRSKQQEVSEDEELSPDGYMPQGSVCKQTEAMFPHRHVRIAMEDFPCLAPSRVLPWLASLDFSSNRTTEVLPTLLSELCPNLSCLSLRDNLLRSLSLSSSVYDALNSPSPSSPTLRFLDVSMNSLSTLASLCGLENLQCPLLMSLVVDNNDLAALPSPFPCAVLDTLWANSNQIQSLPCPTIPLPLLTHLYLEGNKISSLHGIEGCPMLRILDVSFNNIQDPSISPLSAGPISCISQLMCTQDCFYDIICAGELRRLSSCPLMWSLNIVHNPACNDQTDYCLELVSLHLPSLRTYNSSPFAPVALVRRVAATMLSNMRQGLSYLSARAAAAGRPTADLLFPAHPFAPTGWHSALLPLWHRLAPQCLPPVPGEHSQHQILSLFANQVWRSSEATCLAAQDKDEQLHLQTKAQQARSPLDESPLSLSLYQLNRRHSFALDSLNAMKQPSCTRVFIPSVAYQARFEAYRKNRAASSVALWYRRMALCAALDAHANMLKAESAAAVWNRKVEAGRKIYPLWKGAITRHRLRKALQDDIDISEFTKVDVDDWVCVLDVFPSVFGEDTPQRIPGLPMFDGEFSAAKLLASALGDPDFMFSLDLDPPPGNDLRAAPDGETLGSVISMKNDEIRSPQVHPPGREVVPTVETVLEQQDQSLVEQSKNILETEETSKLYEAWSKGKKCTNFSQAKKKHSTWKGTHSRYTYEPQKTTSYAHNPLATTAYAEHPGYAHKQVPGMLLTFPPQAEPVVLEDAAVPFFNAPSQGDIELLSLPSADNDDFFDNPLGHSAPQGDLMSPAALPAATVPVDPGANSLALHGQLGHTGTSIDTACSTSTSITSLLDQTCTGPMLLTPYDAETTTPPMPLHSAGFLHANVWTSQQPNKPQDKPSMASARTRGGRPHAKGRTTKEKEQASTQSSTADAKSRFSRGTSGIDLLTSRPL
eukprot:gene4830-877_t